MLLPLPEVVDVVVDGRPALTLCVCPVYFEDTLLAVWRHGWQRRAQGFTAVLEEITDPRKIYRLVQSDRYSWNVYRGVNRSLAC